MADMTTKAGADLNGDGKVEVIEVVKAVEQEIEKRPWTVAARTLASVKGAVGRFRRWLGF